MLYIYVYIYIIHTYIYIYIYMNNSIRFDTFEKCEIILNDMFMYI